MTSPDIKVAHVPETILRGHSHITPQDIEDAEQLMPLEHGWYQDIPRYATDEDVVNAFMAGELTKVRPTRNYRPIGRFINHQLRHIYPPYVKPYTFAAQTDFSYLWRQEAARLGVADNVCLSFTSFTRSEEYQQELIKGGKLAVEDSTHTAGGAWDTDASGYYIVKDGRVISVSLRGPEVKKAVGRSFTEELGADPQETETADPKEFDRRVVDAVYLAAGYLQRLGLVNLVPELVGQDNECLHIGVNPDYLDLRPPSLADRIELYEAL